MSILDKLPEGLTRAISNLWLKTKKSSPEICVVGGILCGAGALVMVGVRTWKGKDTLKDDVESIKAMTHKTVEESHEQWNGDTEQMEIVTETRLVKVDKAEMTQEQKKELMARRIELGKDILKLYWIPGLLAVSSVGMIWGGRTILRKELSTATAAYATLLETYNQYRKRVAAKIGEEEERQLACGYSLETHVDEKTGEVTQVPVINNEQNLSQYAFWFTDGTFDRDSGEWAWKNYVHNPKDKLQNQFTVSEMQNRFTRDLRCIGYVFLEDVALAFGVSPDEARKFHDIGWVWKKDSENRVDFGVLEGATQLPVNCGFTDPRHSQNECLINPNVDGYIGYVRDDYRKYDFRYGSGELKPKSIERGIMKWLSRYDKEEMERRVMRASR